MVLGYTGAINKKGVLFSLIALLLGGLFILIYTVDIRTPLDSNVELNTMKIARMKLFSDNMDEYLRHAGKIAGYETLEALTLFLSLPDYEADGTCNNNDGCSNTLHDWQELHCRFADLFQDGIIWWRNHTYIVNTNGNQMILDLAMIINDKDDKKLINAWMMAPTEFVRLQESTLDTANYANTEIFGVLQPFPAEESGKLKDIQLQVEFPLNFDGSVFVELYSNSTCNETVLLVDKGNVSFLNPNTALTNITIPFRYGAEIYKEREYAVMVYTTGEYIDLGLTANEDDIEWNVMSNGEPNLQNISMSPRWSSADLREERSLNNYLRKMFDISNTKLFMEADATLDHVSLDMDTEWVVEITAEYTLYLDDRNSVYGKRTEVKSLTTIAGLPEPLSYQYGDIDLYREIKPVSVHDAELNLSHLTNYTADNRSWANSDAPNYLWRLMRNVSPETAYRYYGIESIVDDKGISDRTNLDWYYFNESPADPSTIFPCKEIFVIHPDSIPVGSDPGQFPQEVKDYWQTKYNTPNNHLVYLDWFTIVKFKSGDFREGTCS